MYVYDFNSLMEATEFLTQLEGYIAFCLKGTCLENPMTSTFYMLAEVLFLNTIKLESGSEDKHEIMIHQVETADGQKGYFIDDSCAYGDQDFLESNRLIW